MHVTSSWQKSSFSGTEPDNHCLELATSTHGLVLRESETGAVVLPTTPARLAALLTAVHAGAFERISPPEAD